MTNIQFQRGAIDAGACVSNAWEQIKSNYGLYLGVAIIAILITGCIPCLNLFLIGPVLGGVFYVALRDMRREPVEFGMMFKGFEKFVPLMVIGLLQSIPGLIGQVLQIGIRLGGMGLGGRTSSSGGSDFFQSSAPDFAIAGGVLAIILIVAVAFLIFAVVWAVIFFFAIPIAMENDIGPIDAIKLSAQAGFSNLGGLIVLGIFEGLIGILGLLLCVLGLFFISIPVIYVANAFAYRQVFPYFGGSPTNYNPPPPNAYGFQGGQYS
jgi:uncharacterized membrane protein